MDLEEILDKIGQGMTLNAFCFEFEHEATILLDRLVRLGKVRVERSKKYQITVIMPK